MSEGVLIVEGAEKSGAMITVNDATDQNRDVFAVPGSIYSSLSAAPNRLIVEGATPGRARRATRLNSPRRTIRSWNRCWSRSSPSMSSRIW